MSEVDSDVLGGIARAQGAMGALQSALGTITSSAVSAEDRALRAERRVRELERSILEITGEAVDADQAPLRAAYRRGYSTGYARAKALRDPRNSLRAVA